jgi:hypothetical protein
MILLLNVLHYHFICHVAAAATEIPSRPDVPSPELLSQVRELCQQFVGGLPFQPLQQSDDRHLRRDTHKQMNVVTRYVPFHYRHFVGRADFSNQVAHSQTYFTRECRTAVFRRPNDMQMYLEDGVSATPVIFHEATLARPANLLKPSPKGEGFDPPRVRQ